MDFKTFKNRAPHVIKAGFPVMLRGNHGIGKSEVVYQLAKEMGYGIIERRVSQMGEGDLIGMPDKGMKQFNNKKMKTTKWLPTDWYAEACQSPVFLYLDELDRGTLEVRQGIFELADSRKIYGNELHPGTVVISSINGGGDNGDCYQVAELGLAEFSRWWVVDIKPTHEEWFAYLRTKESVPKSIYTFVTNNTAFIDTPVDTITPGQKHATRRSWMRLCETIHKMNDDEKKDEELVFDIAEGFLGMEIASLLSRHLTVFHEQVTVKDLFIEGKFEKIEHWNQNDHMGFLEEIRKEDYFNKREYTNTELDNITKYIRMLPQEVFMVYWEEINMTSIKYVEDLKSSDPEDFKDTLSYYFHMHDDKKIRDYICDMMNEVVRKKDEDDKKEQSA